MPLLLPWWLIQPARGETEHEISHRTLGPAIERGCRRTVRSRAAIGAGAGGRAGHAAAACQDDAMRLCGQFVPDVDRITACMSRKRKLLSPACRVYFTGGKRRR